MTDELNPSAETGTFDFSLKIASQRSGVGISTIRAWERRYSAIAPHRDASGRRVFSEDQLERLILLGRLVRAGHRISAIARYPNSRLRELDSQDAENRGPGGPEHAALVERILKAAALSDEVNCHRMIASAILTLEPITAVGAVLSPLMVGVGNAWASGRLSVAQEHMITSIVVRRLLAILETLNLAGTGPHLVLGTLAQERHEVGAIFAAFLAACRGIRVTYLGPDLPGRELAQISADLDAQFIAVSLVHQPPGADLGAEFTRLVEDRRRGTQIWLGGAAVSQIAPPPIPSGCEVFATIYDYWRHLDDVA